MYLDHAATTTMRPEAVVALDDALARFDGNASGIHSEARRAKNALEEARELAAMLVGVQRPHDIIFVGSGTEADNLAVMGGALASDRRAVVVSAIEHKAVLGSAHALERFGFSNVRSRHYLFMPQPLYQKIGWLERYLSITHLGGQYCASGRNMPALDHADH